MIIPENIHSAFPFRDGENIIHAGMTLRDYFAAKALQGIVTTFVSDDMLDAFTQTAEENSVSFRQRVADVSYGYADAMLEARKK